VRPIIIPSIMTNDTYYCALGFGDNFFYALGKDALPVPNHFLSKKEEERGEQGREVDGKEHEQQQKTTPTTSTTCVSLMPIHPNDDVAECANDTPIVSKGTTATENEEELDDDEISHEYASAEDWLRHRLLAQSVTASSSRTHGKFISHNLPVLSCGATHTSMIVPGSSSTATKSSSSSANRGEAAPTIAGDAYIVGTIFGHTHHHLTIQPSRLPLRIVRISSGRRHVLALTEGSTPSYSSTTTSSFSSFASSSSSTSPTYGAGVAVSWGAGHFGQLGHGTDITSCLGPRIINRLLPHVVGGKVVDIAAGGLHSAAIVVPLNATNSNCRRVVMYPSTNSSSSGSNNNEILVRETRTFVWGSNRKGQCGIDGGKCATVPEPLPVVSVRRGGGDAMASMTPGSGGDAPTDHPVDKYVHFEKLSLGRLHTVALTAYGEVFAWGSTSMGRCGQGGPTTSSNGGEYNGSSTADRRFVQRPRHVSALRDVVIESIAAGGAHTLALSRGGRVYAWGAGGDGQCGQGHAGNLFSPRVVWGLPPFGGVGGEEESSTHDKSDSCIPHVNSKIAMAVTLEEEALSKALSMSQIKISTSVPPSFEPDSDRVVSIRASGCYSAAITARGEIYTWGYGSGPAIGHPIPIENDLPYIPIIEGNQYSIATSAKVFPEGGSEDNIIRDCRCFDTDLNVMLPRRVECIRTLGLHVEDASLGPGHMVVLCSLKGISDNDDEKQTDSDILLLDTNDGVACGTQFDVPSKNTLKGKAKHQIGTSVSAQGLTLLGDARPTIASTTNATNDPIGDSVTTIESIESSVSDNRRRSSGWMSKIKPSSRARKNSLPASPLPISPESEKKKSFMQKLRRGNASASGGGGAK
jgi:alpha-tubulin suppressor-like RCC1 family protein